MLSVDSSGVRQHALGMRPTANVFRFESAGESGTSFPTLMAAMRQRPSHAEAQVRTSIDGVVLAEAEPISDPGSILVWCLTLAGQDVIDRGHWSAGAPVLRARDIDTVLMSVLGQELAS